MAKLLCQVHWDGKKVETTYTVAHVDPRDEIQVFSKDPEPFIIQADEKTAERLGLHQKAKNDDGKDDLYEVQKGVPAPVKPKEAPTKEKTVLCGTLKNGHFKDWGPGIPLDD